jgi:hypothetical protein
LRRRIWRVQQQRWKCTRKRPFRASERKICKKKKRKTRSKKSGFFFLIQFFKFYSKNIRHDAPRKNQRAEKNDYDKIGGKNYITELLDSVPSSTNIKHYADIVLKKKLMRDLIVYPGGEETEKTKIFLAKSHQI